MTQPDLVRMAPTVATDKRDGGQRHATLRMATIELEGGETISCVIRDISLSGAKLGVARRHRLPEFFNLAIAGRDLTCRVRRAWQRGDFAGVTLVLADRENENEASV
ncbi:PilZ domain-containing protein [Methylobacterium trifolii]|uniref:PilZ domain-containing protein n=1 Tax=Methylobacterium trifolii TaxID=1003092 RepID=UPI001EDD1F99|nr:PilZ domain-containing protein [Methylobacterium trifolii]